MDNTAGILVPSPINNLPDEKQPLLSLHGVTKRFGGLQALGLFEMPGLLREIRFRNNQQLLRHEHVIEGRRHVACDHLLEPAQLIGAEIDAGTRGAQRGADLARREQRLSEPQFSPIEILPAAENVGQRRFTVPDAAEQLALGIVELASDAGKDRHLRQCRGSLFHVARPHPVLVLHRRLHIAIVRRRLRQGLGERQRPRGGYRDW